MNALKELSNFGQSIWLDYLSRSFIRAGNLAELVNRDGVAGVTSNPAIFEKAIGHSNDYDEQIARLVSQGANDPRAIFRELAVSDIRAACDVLMPVYRATRGGDGFASIEVSPDLAHDTAGTMKEARALWRAVDKPNVMIKVPATEEGLPAIRDLTAEGVNVNITLLFARDMYERVAEAYIEGLEARPDSDLDRIASVASFFVSRIDGKIDEAIEKKFAKASDSQLAALQRARGRTAIANAKLAYREYKTIFSGIRWKMLTRRGARPQRLLWASTGTKNKAYSDVLYVETLIGRETINTMPLETMDAWRDHGRPAATLETCLTESEAILAGLEQAGISLSKATTELTEEGVKKFEEAADKLYSAIVDKREALIREHKAHAAE